MDTTPHKIKFQDSIEADRAKHVAAVLEMIKGKEKLPVDSVFKNLKLFKGMPAENLLRIMDTWLEPGTGR